MHYLLAILSIFHLTSIPNYHNVHGIGQVFIGKSVPTIIEGPAMRPTQFNAFAPSMVIGQIENHPRTQFNLIAVYAFYSHPHICANTPWLYRIFFHRPWHPPVSKARLEYIAFSWLQLIVFSKTTKRSGFVQKPINPLPIIDSFSSIWIVH